MKGPLKDLALALFVGMVSGAYSSIFIATPLLAQMKEREPDMKKLAARVQSASRQGKPTRNGSPRRLQHQSPAPAAGDVRAASEMLAPRDQTEPSNAELEEAKVGGRKRQRQAGRSGRRDLQAETYDHTAMGRRSAPSHRTNRAASGRSRRMSLADPARRRDGVESVLERRGAGQPAGS